MGGLVRDLFGAIDSSIYSFITYIYRILMNIADIQIFSSESLKSFSERVYALLAIFMAFKLVFTFINYAVNPDQLNNEKTGGKKLVTNIMVSLILLVAVPGIIFPLSRRIQYAILEEGVLQEVILGVDQSAYAQTKNTLRAGRSMSYSVFTAFFTPNPPATTEGDYCSDDTIRFYRNEEGTCNGGTCADEEEGLKNLRYQLDGNCAAAIAASLEGTDTDAEKVVNTYERAYNQFSTKVLLNGKGDYDLKRIKTKDGEFLFDYKILLSTIAGLAVGWMLVVFCFQIAVRTIKLGFLELVAPIPILSYIDSKSKAKSFDGWVKTCISAYLDLFVRLAALYFAIFVISSVSLGNLTYASNSFKTGADQESVGLVVKFFIIMGALMFVEKVPKLVEDIFGVKLDGSFSLNPLKDSALASKVVGGTVGLAAGSALGLASNAANVAMKHKENNEIKKSNAKLLEDLKAKHRNADDTVDNETVDRLYKEQMKQEIDVPSLGKAATSMAGGFFGGAFRSGMAGYKSKNAYKGTIEGVTASSRSRNLRETGYGGMQRLANFATDVAGIPNPKLGTTDTYDAETKAMKQNLGFLQESLHSASNAVHDMFRENVQALSGIINNATGEWTVKNYNEYIDNKKAEIMKEYKQSNEYRQEVERAKNTYGEGTQLYEERMRRVLNEGVGKMFHEAERDGKIASERLFNDYRTLHTNFIETRDASTKLQKDITRREEIRAKNKQ